MKICPKCESGYPDELQTCPLHGGLLSEIRDLKPGMLVRNTYRIVRKLNKGGMANVYLAQHVLLNEKQVLKFLSADLSSDQDWATRFLREVRTLRQIRHKNVVNAGNLEPAEDGTLFFSMEYIEGPDLLDFYRSAPKPFDVRLALELVYAIAEGLGAAHALGVVHRDIKPENILIAVEGNTLVPKIADFGIVATREDSRLTQSGNAMLTPQFAAPEQWIGKRTSELDGRTDFYALGGLLFELLTGKGPFKADNYNGWGQLHLHAPAPVPSSLRADLKDWRGIDDLVLRLLAKNPEDRPADVAEVLQLLEAIEYVPSEPPNREPALEPDVPRTTEAFATVAPREPTHRARFISEQSKSLEFPPTTLRDREIPPRRAIQWRTWIVVAALLIVLALVGRRFAINSIQVRTLSNQKDAIFAVAFAPNGIGLASASRDNTVQFWNVNDGQALGTIQATTTALAFSPDGHALATGMEDDSINLWDAAQTSVLITMAGHTGRVAAVAFSPDGQRLASAGWDKTVRLWDVSNGRLLYTFSGHTDRVLALAYSADGRILASAGADQTIRIWDTSLGTQLQTLRGHTRAINALAFSQDGHTLASASDDHTVKLWNVTAGQDPSQGAGPIADHAVRTLQGHSGPVLSLSFSPDGRTLASASADETVRLWDTSTGQLLRALKGHTGPVLSVAFSPLGYTVASGSADKTVRLWEVASLRE